MTAGYRALRESAAWLDLDSRGRFKMSGEDRARLLHAMTTNHIQQLGPGQGCYVFFLNAQGRILGDANVLCLDDHLLLDTEPETHQTLFQHLDRYIIADDVTLDDAQGALSAIGVEGPESAAALQRAGIAVPEADYGHVAQGALLVAKLTSTGAPGYRLFGPVADRPSILDRLGLPGATADEARIVRIEHHWPRYGEDITERYLVHETRQLHAVHFSKGCYLGQEIVERVRSRGQVHRLLTAMTIDTDAPIAAGTPLTSDGKPAGEITSAAVSPAVGKTVALGYLRAGFARPDAVLQAGGFEARIAGTP